MSVLRKIKKHILSPKELFYLKYRTNLEISNQTILLEGSHGREISGHIYVLANQLLKKYPSFKLYIAVKKDAYIPPEFTNNIVLHMSDKYLRILASAKYLINDTSFWSFFHKRPEQKYFIFWHGTPLKCLGKSTQVQGYGNVQRNLASADQIFVSNKFTSDILAEDFGISGIVHNQIVIAPSPRNSLLLAGKVVMGRYVYMPTWRGVDVGNHKLSEEFLRNLHLLDDSLGDQEEVYVKLHPFDAGLLNFTSEGFKHLKEFPHHIETYSFLATAEKLITDYSSIMFDFMITNRSVILFPFDEQEYKVERGMYLALEKLPFPLVRNVEDLITELNQTKEINYRSLKKELVGKDHVTGVNDILNYLFGDKNPTNFQVIDNWNGRENVLIYAYRFDDNGITSSLLNLLDEIDLSKRNYIITWPDGIIPKSLEYKIAALPEGVFTFIESGKTQATVSESIQTYLYMNQRTAQHNIVRKMYLRDFDRIFPNLSASYFIHYPGYDRSYAVWVSALRDIGIRTIIFVHTDMEKEFIINPSLKPRVLFEAYQNADYVVCVTNSVASKIKALVPNSKTIVMNVLISPKKIREVANRPLPELSQRLRESFEDPTITVFINIGRFSKQKGLDRLIKAFEELNRADTRLVIIGSYGPIEEQIRHQIAVSERKNDIFLYENLVQPYNFLRAADAFVFSSRYEGLGMVVFEAFAVKTPVIMTDIPETLEAIGENNPAIVIENSTHGIKQGMFQYLMKGAPKINFDFHNYETRALLTWEQLFESRN